MDFWWVWLIFTVAVLAVILVTTGAEKILWGWWFQKSGKPVVVTDGIKTAGKVGPPATPSRKMPKPGGMRRALEGIFRGRGTMMRKRRPVGRRGGPYFEVVSNREMYTRQLEWHLRKRVRVHPALMHKAVRYGVEVPEKLRPKGWAWAERSQSAA